MKKISSLLFILSLLTVSLYAQKMSDSNRLSIGIWIPEQIEALTPAAHGILENKLNQIIINNGIGDTPYSRFILSANVVVLTKDVLANAQPTWAYSLEVTFYIGDGFEGKSYATYTMPLKGVGESETKAYISAIRNIDPRNPAFASFLDKGKAKIIAYYEANCDYIIKEAKTLTTISEYDKAIWLLTSIPSVSTSCFDKAMSTANHIFKEKNDFDCKQKMTQATAVWNANQSWDGANQAGAILSSINPNAACYGEVKVLSNQIAKRIYEMDKREWKFVIDKEIGLQKDIIKAYRDIGTAWGNGQPKNITYKSLW